MKMRSVSIVLAGLMVFASIGGYAARPSAKAAQRGQGIVLENVVPQRFGDWRMLPPDSAQVVNPQT